MMVMKRHSRLAGMPLAVVAALAMWGGPSVAQAVRPTTAPTGDFPVVQAWRDLKMLRVCGDPDNMPFSNAKEEGFDNKIAEVIARAMGDSVVYLWWPHRRGFVRSTLRAAECDVIIGVPTNFDPALETKPYYRSTYYFVSRRDRNLHVTSLDDPALKTLRVGVNLIGYDYTNTPPAEALAARGISKNVKGFSTFYGPETAKPADIIDAVVKGTIDVALVWGPLAGYYAKHASVPLELVPLPDSDAKSGVPFAYDMAIGVRHSDQDLRATLDSILTAKGDAIRQILGEYAVPTLPPVRP